MTKCVFRLRAVALALCLALCTLLLSARASEAKDVGQIISLQPGVSALRDGQRVDMDMKSPVGDKDVLTTDATGRAQVLFDDDTTVALGSNTSLSLEQVVTEGSSPAFRARMGQGVARFITGKIVEKNPDGFSVVTPDATVGIRGTIFAVQVGNGVTTVFVTNTTKQVFVNGIHVPTGFKITLPQGGVAPMTPADRNQISGSVASREAAPASAAQIAPPPPAVAGTALAPTALAQTPLAAQGIGESIKALGNAQVAGGLFDGDLVSAGSFSFTANLGSGAVSNGSMNVFDGVGGTFNTTGGSGSIAGGALNIGDFSDPSAYMTGTASVNGSGLSVAGTYSTMSGDFHGTFSGSQK